MTSPPLQEKIGPGARRGAVLATELPDVMTTCPHPARPRLRCLLLSFLASPLGLLVVLTGVLQLLGPG